MGCRSLLPSQPESRRRCKLQAVSAETVSWALSSKAEQDMVLFAATAALRLESHLCTGASARVEPRQPRHVDDAV